MSTALDRAAPRKPRTLTVTGRVRRAIDAMVWQGLKRADAAKAGDLAEHSLYVALTRPHVKAYYLAQCEVLRVSGRARRIHRLDALSEQDENKAAAVQAIKALEQLGDDPQANAQRVQTPGIVIVVGTQPAAPMTIDAVKGPASD